MLPKYLSAARIITVICSILATTLQVANASQSLLESIDSGKLTVKHKKETSTNVDRQSDIESIHKTLTQFYRGLNECNVALVEKNFAGVEKVPLLRDKYLSELSESCTFVRQGSLQRSYEIKNIELVSLSDNQATVTIDLIQTFQYIFMERPSILNLSISYSLIKSKGRWRVSYFLTKSAVPVGEIYWPKF